MLHKKERETFSGYAFLTENTKGRNIPLKSDGIRNDFQRDRDRILHSKSFRRLNHKTQVFYDPEGDHYRNRLTHTLEVAQIGRTMARALKLNEDLTEAGCLGHDLGHTPFGHSGEFVLNKLTGNFRHNEQSLRTVERLERNFTGLNLTVEVRDAILCHTGDGQADTLEGRLVKYADRIAYINHDIDDAIRAGIIKQSDIPSGITAVLGDNHSDRISVLVNSLITTSFDKPYIKVEDEVWNAEERLRDFLFERVYMDKKTKEEEKKVHNLIESLYEHFIGNPRELPPEYSLITESEGHMRSVCDYIAGMTDRYAVKVYTKIFIPRTWSN